MSEDPDIYFHLPLTWCIGRADRVDSWSWGRERDWTSDEWDSIIDAFFTKLGHSSWKDIMTLHVRNKGKKRIPKHYSYSVLRLRDEAVERWIEIDLAQYDEVFKFRLAAKRRIYGIRSLNHFHLVWWDPVHKIHPTTA